MRKKTIRKDNCKGCGKEFDSKLTNVGLNKWSNIVPQNVIETTGDLIGEGLKFMARKASQKTLKNKADRLFSEFIRRKGFCEWCGKKDNTLQCSHIFSRRFLVTRWEPINATCLCASCHFKWHQKPIEAVEWVKEYLGEDVYDELRRMAKTSVKKVDLEQKIEMIKQYKHAEEL